MSKISRLKHEKPEFEPSDMACDDEELCVECGFFVKQPNRDICAFCEEIEQSMKVPQ